MLFFLVVKPPGMTLSKQMNERYLLYVFTIRHLSPPGLGYGSSQHERSR